LGQKSSWANIPFVRTFHSRPAIEQIEKTSAMSFLRSTTDLATAAMLTGSRPRPLGPKGCANGALVGSGVHARRGDRSVPRVPRLGPFGHEGASPSLLKAERRFERRIAHPEVVGGS